MTVDARTRSGPGQILLGVFQVFDSAQVPYCVLHGYDNFPDRITSDVDLIVSREVRLRRLTDLLHENSETCINARLVCARGGYLVLARRNADRSTCFLELDLSHDCGLGNLQFYSEREVIRGRRRYHTFWVPPPNIEFGSYLARKIAKGSLNDEQGQRLSALYQQDPAGCRQRIAQFWGAEETMLIASAADAGEWEGVRRRLRGLHAKLHRRLVLHHPSIVLANCLRGAGRRMRLAFRPDGGLTVVFLGPDGAGKSSVIRAISRDLGCAFPHSVCYSFPPALLGRRRRTAAADPLPHDLPPRSAIASVTRAVCYWLPYYLVCYPLLVRIPLARSTLVLHDRHFLDTLVDPRRYRYSGPRWLLRLVWRLLPKPNLVILLDAPPEVLQARKQDVPFDESARQREAYLSLTPLIPNGHVVDSARPLRETVHDVNDLILQCLSTRVAHRLRLRQVSRPRVERSK